EDTWAAVGWSPEILATLDREPELTAAIPTEGTLLTADLWVRPNASSAAATTANSAQTPASDSFQQIQQWIQFCWQPAIANQLSLLSDATSPIFVGSGRAQASPLLQSKPLLLPPEAALQNSEFLQPLPPAAIDQYRRQWLQTRQATLLQSLELPPAQMGQGTRHS
nr:hypothetical protein [Oculatellaceae cyanobacterium Prado106]